VHRRPDQSYRQDVSQTAQNTIFRTVAFPILNAHLLQSWMLPNGRACLSHILKCAVLPWRTSSGPTRSKRSRCRNHFNYVIEAADLKMFRRNGIIGGREGRERDVIGEVGLCVSPEKPPFVGFRLARRICKRLVQNCVGNIGRPMECETAALCGHFNRCTPEIVTPPTSRGCASPAGLPSSTR